MTAMKIIGISCYYHDSAAALIIGDQVIAAAQEERFTRRKNEQEFPHHAICYCLAEAGLKLIDIDAFVYYENPDLKFKRIMFTWLLTAPTGLFFFLETARDWILNKQWVKRKIRKELKLIQPEGNPCLLFSNHHLSHAASAFFTSGFTESAILTIDGVGEFSTAGIYSGNGSDITLIKELRFPDSIGLLYSAVTWFLGFKVDSGEYKVMGLAPYGNRDSAGVVFFKKTLLADVVHVFEDGSVKLNQNFFSYFSGRCIIDETAWEKKFQMKRRLPESQLLQEHCDLALAIQEINDEIVLKLAIEAKKLTGSSNICLAGGVALNCVSNSYLMRAAVFDKMHIHTASGDAGGALGAALAAQYIHYEMPRNPATDYAEYVYSGPGFTAPQIVETFRKHAVKYKQTDSWEALFEVTAAALADGKIIGWFQDRMEWGARALGNRSILADAGNTEMQLKLNVNIKKREGFRPFAPVVTEEDALDYFDVPPSEHMVHVTGIRQDKRKDIPAEFSFRSMTEKMRHIKSTLPAITHIDFTARAQAVTASGNHKLWRLVKEFGKRSGYPVLINTSMNVRGEPIACTPEDALGVFAQTGMDYLVIENFIVNKAENMHLTTSNVLVKSFNLD
ncbi:MAG: hypothetical protein JHC61_00235 [Burkholderiaceae bacterium]|nr:hypothetical protein [Burkholderiaceae bacterium]